MAKSTALSNYKRVANILLESLCDSGPTAQLG